MVKFHKTDEDFFKFSSATQCRPADMVFLLDNSVKGEATNFDLEINFAVDVLERLMINNACILFGAVLFGTPVQNPFFLKTHEQNTFAIINQIRALVNLKTQKNLAEALADMTDVQFTPANGDRPNAPNIAIIITDGQSDSDPDRTAVEEAMRAKHRPNNPIEIFAVGINGNINSGELQTISSKSILHS